jgi:hypothetical protein
MKQHPARNDMARAMRKRNIMTRTRKCERITIMLRNSRTSQETDHHSKIDPHQKVIGFRTIHALHCSSPGTICPFVLSVP